MEEKSSPRTTPVRQLNRQATRLIARIVAPLAGVLTIGCAVAEPLPRTVLFLDQGAASIPAARATTKAFQDAMNKASGGSVFVHIEFLAIPIFGGAHYGDALRDYFRQKYRDRPIGVIVTRGTAMLSYAVRLRDELWPDTALVFSGVSDRAAAELKLPPNVTGTTYIGRLQDMVDVAERLVPTLHRIALVGDRLDSKNVPNRYVQDLPAVEAKVEVIDLTNLALPEVRKRVATLPNDAAIAYVNFNVDDAGIPYVSRDVLQSFAEVANRPIVVDSETTIGLGATGGRVVTYEDVGKDAARLALIILNGESASATPIGKTYNRLIFDWRQLQRWNVDTARLPAESEIRFRPPTAWEQYRAQIVLVAMALLLQTLLIAWLIYEHRRRYCAELESRRRMGELAHMNRSAAIGEMSASIAHEINQPLAGIVMNVGSALRFLGRAPPELEGVRSVLSMILRDGNRASQIISTIRAMFKKDIQDKVPIRINEPVREILALLRSELDERKVSVNLMLAEGLPQIVGNRIQLQQVIMNLVRNAAEAMNGNVVGARTLRIRSEADEAGDMVLTIEDSGPGIDAKNLDRIFEPFFTTKPDGMGMGLSICRSIVEAHGGRLTAAQAKTHGMTFQIVLPHGPVK